MKKVSRYQELKSDKFPNKLFDGINDFDLDSVRIERSARRRKNGWVKDKERKRKKEREREWERKKERERERGDDNDKESECH